MEKSNPLDLTRMSHPELKECGNRFFAVSDNKRAIECYSLAIKKNGSISVYYSNRALCYLQMRAYDLAFSDCRRALEIDPNNLKAFFFAGQCHLALGQYDEAVAKLTTAHSLAVENHRNFGDDITSSIRLAKRKRFQKLDEKRHEQEIDLQIYLNKLIVEECNRRKKTLEAAVSTNDDDKVCEANASTKPMTTDTADFGVVPSEDSQAVGACVEAQVSICKTQGFADIDAEAANRLKEVEDIFAQVDERRMKREVPDYLCGQISFELMHDPVIAPSGITYDRASILCHLRQVGHFDPITRKPLTYEQLIPNLAMKEVVAKFIEENPWAADVY